MLTEWCFLYSGSLEKLVVQSHMLLIPVIASQFMLASKMEVWGFSLLQTLDWDAEYYRLRIYLRIQGNAFLSVYGIVDIFCQTSFSDKIIVAFMWCEWPI